MNSNSSTTAPFDDLVSVREAAALLRVSESTIWRWINDDVLPSYRLGRKRVYLKRAELMPVRRSHREMPNRLPTAADEASAASAARARAAELLQRVRALHDRQRATPGWGRGREAWEDINEMRDERAWHLDPSR